MWAAGKRSSSVPLHEEILRQCAKPEIRAVGFDLDGVLFDTATLKSLSHIGLKRLLGFLLRTRSFPSRNGYYDGLRVPELEREAGGMSVLHDDGEMPSILTAWQCGYVTGEEAERDIAAFLDEKCSLSHAEREVFKCMAHLMLHPPTFIGTRVSLDKGLELLNFLAESSDKPLLLFCLSNWDSASFELLKEEFPHIFKHMHALVISGEARCCKPSLEVFQHALEKLRAVEGYSDLQPSEIFFMDDEQVNVEGAQKAGFRAIHYEL